MIKFIYYSLRNLIYYRKERSITNSQLHSIATNDDPKIYVTNILLTTVGLKVVDSKTEIPWYIPLSRIQRSWIRRAEKYGYRIGLR
jgi:hypothetical protein